MAAQSPAKISSGGRKTPQKSTKKAQKKLWVVKLKRIPFGFFEKELLGYFRQFGNVLRIRLARSRKTGNHKGWAYIGFDNKSVAEIAAESMNGYLMFEQRLGCKLMKPSTIPKSMLKGPLLVTRPSYLGVAKKDALARNRAGTKNETSNAKRRVTQLNKTLDKLRNLGIDYEFPVAGVKRTPLKKVEDNDVQVIAAPKTPVQKPATPKAATPKAATPKAATPKAAIPKAATPKVATPKPATPKVATPKPETPKPQISKVTATPKTVKKVVINTPAKSPAEALKKAENTPRFSPKTRAAKAAAAGTPLAKSTLSKTILKSVAASARPAAVEKKPVAAKGRGKKKSL